MPESRIQQMQHGVFAAADVEVDWHPIPLQIRIDQSSAIFRVDESQIVPAAAGPLRHRARLTPGRLAARRVGRHEPVFEVRQRAFSGTGGFELVDCRKSQWQLLFGKRSRTP